MSFGKQTGPSVSVGPCPCDNCAMREHCDDMDMACRDFAGYVYTGMNIMESRIPTKKQFRAIFHRFADESFATV